MGDVPDPDEEPKHKELDEDDISLLRTYGLGPYSARIDAASKDIKDIIKRWELLASCSLKFCKCTAFSWACAQSG